MSTANWLPNWPGAMHRVSKSETTALPLTPRSQPSTLDKAVSGLISPLRRVSDCTAAAPSFNGRTVGSEPINRGSNPWGATKNLNARLRRAFFIALFCTFSHFLGRYK